MAGCSISKIKGDANTRIRGIISKINPDIPFNRFGNPIVRGEKEISSIKTSIEAWSEATFGKKYEGKWIQEQKREGNSVLHLRFPTSLEESYNAKTKENPIETPKNRSLDSDNLSQDASYSLVPNTVVPSPPPKKKLH